MHHIKAVFGLKEFQIQVIESNKEITLTLYYPFTDGCNKLLNEKQNLTFHYYRNYIYVQVLVALIEMNDTIG